MGTTDILVTTYGPWVFLAYILIRDILPKIAPEWLKVFSSKISTENRLFDVLEKNNQCSLLLAKALGDLTNTLESLENRVHNLESAVIEDRKEKLISK